MANRQLSVKFDTEGFQAAISQMQAIGKAFDVVLLNAQNNIKIAQREIAAASNNGNIDQMAEAQKLLEQNTKIANRAIAASYRELGIKSSESLNNLRAQAVSAFEAIKISGTAQALDIGRAQDALTNKLKQLEAQLNSQNVNAYKLLGVQSRAELTEARQQIMDAYQTLKQGADSSRQSQEELGLAYRSMTEKIAAINQQLNQSVASNDLNAAYKLLGVRSEADLQIAVAQIRQAYETIREARGVGTEDEVAARKAMQSQLNAINDLSEAYNLLGIRNRDQLLATKQQVETAWASISVRNRLTGQELTYAYQSYLGKIQEIDKELNKTIAQRQVEDAYKLLGVRSEADLKKARDEIIQSYELIRNASGANSPDGLAALSARNSQVKAINSQLGIKDPAAELSNAYNMLGFRSKEELIKAQQEIKAAYDLIRESGLRNYRDIGLAAAAYQQQLREINQELNQTAKSRQRDDAFKLLGIRSEADLNQARQEIRSAFDAIDRSTEKTANDVRRAREAMGEMLAQINSELAKTSTPPKGVGDAFNLLGVRSEAELLKARDEILQAYQMIADAAAKLQTTMSVDDIKAKFGNKFADVKNALGITARSWNDLATVYNERLASQPGSATNRDQEAAMRAMAERIKNINSELGIKDETKQLGDAYRSLGFRSEAELKKAIQEIAAAYDLIRSKVGQLGVSQRDVELAADALQKKIKQLANELKSVQERGVQDAYKLLGVRSEADLNQAIQEIEQAFQTIANSKNKSNSDMIRAEEAMLSRVKQLRAEIARTGTSPTNVNDAYKLLGVRSEAEINKAKNDIRNAFNEIQQAGSRRDITVAQDALIAKLKQLDAELAGTAVKTNILKSSIDSLALALKMQLTFAISGILLSLPASIGQLITGFADFERQISTLKAVSQGTKGELSAVRDEIERLGRSTSKTPEDIAKLSVELARAGYNSGEITSALNGIVKASEAAGEDLTQVGTIITGVLKAYSLPASESGRIADLLTQTANKAAVSVVDLGESLKYVGTSAAGSNQKVEDVLVVLGLMGNVMLKSGQAGRNYAQTLDKMKLSSAAVSDELIVSSRGMETAGEAMKRLGVSFRDSDGQIRPFLDILPELKEKMKSLPQQDQDVISRVLFGVEGGRAIQTTLRATGKDIDYLSKALKEADGVADKTSKTINDDLKGSFNSLAGSAQVLSNQIVSQVAPAIKGAIDGIIKIVNALSKDVSTLIGILGGLAVSGVTGLVINAIRALSVAIAALIVQIQAAGGTVAFFKGGLVALLSPTNLAVAAIGILAGTLIKFSMDAQQARESALSLGSALDALAMRKDKTALIDLDDKERKAREGLEGIDRELERKKAQVAASGTGWDWLPGNKFRRTETEREIKRLEAEKQDAIAELQRIPSVRQQILDNQSGKNKAPSDFATRNPTVGAPLPPPTPDKVKTTSTRSASQSKKEEEYYEFSVARPTSGPVSSPYGMRTRNGKTRLHDGIDYAPPAGTPVVAPLPGKVTKVAFEAGGAGNYVTIETIDKAGKKIEQVFMHLISKALVGVGETVKQGDLIGRVGSTGDSSGPHLHWRTRINGQSVNPTAFEKMKFTLPSGAGKPSDYLRSQDAAAQKSDKNPLIQEVLAMSKRLGINPMDILRVMMFETGGTLSPKAHGNGAVGLIGFTKDNEKELGISLANLARMSAVQQIPYVERYLQIHARGQKLDSYQKVGSTVFRGNPNAGLGEGDGKINLGNYLKIADSRYGEKARNLISQNDKPRGEVLEQQAEFKAQSEDIRKQQTKSFLSENGQIIDTEKLRIIQESQQKIYDLKIQSLNADEINRSYIEQEIRMQELLTNAQVKKLELIGKQQQIEGEISFLEADKAKLTTTESERLRELYIERKKITTEIELANKESERAITLQRLESEARRSVAVERLRGELEVILEKVIPKKTLEGLEKDLNEVIVSILQERNALNKKLDEASKLSDQISFDKITEALKELDKQLPNFLNLNFNSIRKSLSTNIPPEDLKTYRTDDKAREEAILKTRKYYDQLRLDTELLIAAARKNGYTETLSQQQDLLNLINKTGTQQLKQIQDQGNILNNVVETAKDALASGLSQLFTDLITGTKSLEDSFKSFASSILKAIADMAIQAAAKEVTGYIFGSIAGFADGGYVSGAGTGRSDSIPARLSNGEFVMSANSVKHWGVGLLDNLNNRRMPNLAFESPSYNGGSNVSRSATIVMNVNTPDANSFRRSETQMGRDAGEQLRRSMQRNG